MIRPQRGMLLLPVALALAVVGALAYTMTREGAVSVSAVDDQYDIEVARYLAEAGLRLAKWQNEKNSCTSPVKFSKLDLAGGSVVANDVDPDDDEIDIEVTATSAPRGGRESAVIRLTRNKLPFFDRRTAPRQLTLPSSDGEDTFIQLGSGRKGDEIYLEATDGKSHPLLQFSLGRVPDKARIVKAELSLYQYESKSVQVERALAVHALSRDWNKDATWPLPWTSPGGDYEAGPAATTVIAGSGRYAWQVTPLVSRWAARTQPNFGVLFKASGLNEARFYSLNNVSERPTLVIDYYPRCAN